VKLREGCPDDDIWQSEFCCQFISDASSWITWDQIQAAESIFASIDLPEGFKSVGELFLGIDIGRKKRPDRRLPAGKALGVFWTRAIVRMRAVPFAMQRKRIDWFFEHLPIRRCCFDSTGIGMQMSEELQIKWGSYRVEPVTFTLAVKEDLAVRTRRNYEEEPSASPTTAIFAAQFTPVRRIPTAAGNFRFDADRTELGHRR